MLEPPPQYLFCHCASCTSYCHQNGAQTIHLHLGNDQLVQSGDWIIYFSRQPGDFIFTKNLITLFIYKKTLVVRNVTMVYIQFNCVFGMDSMGEVAMNKIPQNHVQNEPEICNMKKWKWFWICGARIRLSWPPDFGTGSHQTHQTRNLKVKYAVFKVSGLIYEVHFTASVVNCVDISGNSSQWKCSL